MLARPEVGSHAHIQLWLNDKEPGADYNWENAHECACGQYSHEYGDPNSTRWIASEWIGRLNTCASEAPRTFGALAERWARLSPGEYA
jgi:hypothetical protein